MLSKIKEKKKKRTKTKYENKNKKFSQKKISVGEIRRYGSIALFGEFGKKKFKEREVVQVCYGVT